MKASTHGACATSQVRKFEFVARGENEFGIQVCIDAFAEYKRLTVKRRLDFFDRSHFHAESEPHLKLRVAIAGSLDFHFIVGMDRDEYLRNADVFLGVEIGDQILMRDDLLINDYALAGINSAKLSRRERSPAHNDWLACQIFQ